MQCFLFIDPIIPFCFLFSVENTYTMLDSQVHVTFYETEMKRSPCAGKRVVGKRAVGDPRAVRRSVN